MLIVHTSDLHLKVDEPWAWMALDRILAFCHQKSADALVIAGDIIDRAVSFYEIEGKLRSTLSGVEFPVIIVPGNHDPLALYSENIFLGPTVTILKTPGEKIKIENVYFWALPHSEELVEGGKHRILEVLHHINEAINSENSLSGFHVLLYHGDFNHTGSDEKGEERYLNIEPEFLETSLFQVILAGHLHKQPHRFTLKNGRSFIIYPGSPWPVTRGELNRRYINVVNISNKSFSHEFIPLDVPFYVREKITLLPGTAIKEQVENFFNNLFTSNPQAKIILEIDGLFAPEGEFQNLESFYRYLEELKNSSKIFDFDLSGLVDLSRVEKDPLFAKLRDKISHVFSEEKSKIRALKYMAQIFSMTVETERNIIR